MSATCESPGPISPEKLLAPFTRTPFFLIVLLAIGIHVVLIGGTSLRFIKDTYIDPEGAKERKAAAAASAASNAPAPAATSAPAAAATNAASAKATATPAATPGMVKVGNDLVPADRTNAAVLKQINEKAEPKDIPAVPDDLGLSIQDTNKK